MQNSSKACATKGRNITNNRDLSEKSKRKRPSCLDKDFEYNFSDVSEDELNFEIEPFGSYTFTEKTTSNKGKVAKKRKNEMEPIKSKVIEKPNENFTETRNLVCDYCLSTSEKNRVGEKEILLICKDCGAKAHPSCMDYTKDLAERAYRTDWQCIDCKTCCLCQDPGDADSMLFCDACDKGYHMTCHQPALNEKPLGNWVCETCRLENDKILSVEYNTVSQDSSDQKLSASDDVNITSPNSSNNSNDVYLENTEKSSDSDQNSETKFSTKFSVKFFDVNTTLPKLADTLPSNPPDASKWSIDDVFHYFTDVGFGLHAAVFREQEIDGQSLLLMKRNDVITGLALRLGPALKIFAHVQRLQGSFENT